jgi:ABC-type glycerol-3-phosphate transport system substrate-binding protein
MKTIISFIILILTLAACSSTKKTAATTAPTHKVTQLDLLKGGTSFENAIVIKVKNEKAGLEEEYRWLAQSYPGYALVRKTQTSRTNRHYDIITFKTKNGEEKIAYFDITSFFGK